MGISRPTIHKYKEKAESEGYLDQKRELPGNEELVESLGPAPEPPKTPSTVESYQEIVKNYLEQNLQMTVIYQRLRENYGYEGSYSSVRRFVHHFKPVEKEVFTRVNTEPGEEMQVDFGFVGQIFDPRTKKTRNGHVFVATLGNSRHQYAEIVFDQKTNTWIGLHQRTVSSLCIDLLDVAAPGLR